MNKSIKEKYKVSPVDKIEIKDWILKKHYAKTMPSIMYAFGLLNEENILQRVCCYGTPANNHNNSLGDYKCIELVRLVLNDGHEKNIASYYVKCRY